MDVERTRAPESQEGQASCRSGARQEDWINALQSLPSSAWPALRPAARDPSRHFPTPQFLPLDNLRRSTPCSPGRPTWWALNSSRFSGPLEEIALATTRSRQGFQC